MYVVATEYKFHNYMKLTIMYVAKISHTKYIGNQGFYMIECACLLPAQAFLKLFLLVCVRRFVCPLLRLLITTNISVLT